jgi:hypothetical protein
MEQGMKEQDLLKIRMENARAVLEEERDAPKDLGQEGQFIALEMKVNALKERSEDVRIVYGIS